MNEDTPKLRLLPPDSPEDLAHRFERETRPALAERELRMESALEGFRVGSVPFLNATPLTRGLEDQILFLPPSQLAVKLREGELDAALLSISESIFHAEYSLVDGVAIASLGEVQSVFLAHRQPLKEMREVYCDTASLASLNLMKVLFAEHGLRPELKPLPGYDLAPSLDNVLLIGDPAIRFALAPHEHEIWDFGTAWMELTGLPFVYAAWTVRPGVDAPKLARILRQTKRFGMDTLDRIIADRTDFTCEFRKDYLEWHIHFHLGNDERRGIARFIELLRKHNLGSAHEPKWV